MIKTLIAAVSSVILLTSCEVPSKPAGKDGYTFHAKEFEKQQVHVRIVTYSSFAALRAEARKYKIEPGANKEIVAFSILEKPLYDHCTVHMIDPAVKYLPEFVGHEMTHCFYGQWHKNNASDGR